MKFLKQFWKGWKDGWNDYVRRMAQGQYCHFLGAILGAIGSAAAGALSGGKGGGGLLEQILGGIAGGASGLAGSDQVKPEEEYEAREKYETSMMNKRRQMFREEGFKPQTPMYDTSKDLGIFDPMIKSAVMGSFRDIFGADTVARWGMDFDQMKKISAEREVAMEQQQQPQQAEMPELPERLFRGGGGMHRPWQDREMY